MPHKDPEVRKAYLREYYRKRKAADPDYNKKAWKKVRNNSEKYKEYIEAKRVAYHNPDTGRKLKQKNAYLKTTYGITLDDFNKMFEEQQGCCAICGAHQSEFIKALHVDHSHKTGKVRQLLCSQCNCALGIVEDEAFLFNLLKYLERHEEL